MKGPSDDAAVAVVLAAGGYPGTPRSGDEITGLDAPSPPSTAVVQAGTALDDAGRVVSAGGRVLAVVGTGPDLGAARDAAYARMATLGLAA